MAEDTRIPFSRAAGWAGSLADKPVVLCSVVFFVGPYKVLSLPRDPMTGSPLPSLSFSLSRSSESGSSLETRASPRGISEELSKYSSTRGSLFATVLQLRAGNVDLRRWLVFYLAFSRCSEFRCPSVFLFFPFLFFLSY